MPIDDTKLSVKAFINNGKGKVLVLKDASSSWIDLPGGHLQDGETTEEGLKREVYEETGLSVTKYEELFTHDLPLGIPPKTRPIVFFECIANGILRLSKEHTNYMWAGLEDLKYLNLGVFKPLVKEYLTNKRQLVMKMNKLGDEVLHGRSNQRGKVVRTDEDENGDKLFVVETKEKRTFKAPSEQFTKEARYLEKDMKAFLKYIKDNKHHKSSKRQRVPERDSDRKYEIDPGQTY